MVVVVLVLSVFLNCLLERRDDSELADDEFGIDDEEECFLSSSMSTLRSDLLSDICTHTFSIGNLFSGVLKSSYLSCRLVFSAIMRLS